MKTKEVVSTEEIENELTEERRVQAKEIIKGMVEDVKICKEILKEAEEQLALWMDADVDNLLKAWGY